MVNFSWQAVGKQSNLISFDLIKSIRLCLKWLIRFYSSDKSPITS